MGVGMSQAEELKGMAAQKLSVACAMAFAGFMLASDVAPEVTVGVDPQPAKRASQGSTASVSDTLQLVASLQQLLDVAYAKLLNGAMPRMLLDHPFGTITDILTRALTGLKPLRGAGELGQDGDRLVIAIAEARYKADRNANLIRQMTTEPKVFASEIDSDGLVALARAGREAAAGFNA